MDGLPRISGSWHAVFWDIGPLVSLLLNKLARDGLMVLRSGWPQCANILQAICTDVSLVKENHIAKSRFGGWGNRLTLVGGTAKGLYTFMKEKNLKLL